MTPTPVTDLAQAWRMLAEAYDKHIGSDVGLCLVLNDLRSAGKIAPVTVQAMRSEIRAEIEARFGLPDAYAYYPRSGYQLSRDYSLSKSAADRARVLACLMFAERAESGAAP